MQLEPMTSQSVAARERTTATVVDGPRNRSIWLRRLALWMPPAWLARAVDRLRAALLALHRRTTLAPVAVLELVLSGWLSQSIYAAAKLGVADALGHGPRSPEQLAKALGANEEALTRLLRVLIPYGLFARRRDGRFENSALSRSLQRHARPSLRDFVLYVGSPQHREHWSMLDRVVSRGGSGVTLLRGEPMFEYLKTDREYGALFDAGMTSIAELGRDSVLAAYDFTRFGVIADVGGGQGSQLANILKYAPDARGVLFDLPDVTAGALQLLEQHGVSQRVHVESGSFFDRVPSGADAYVLKNVLHDWDDAHAERILSKVRLAISEHGRLLLIESVVPEGPTPHLSKLTDMEMLILAGKERTQSEFRRLLAAAGFSLARIVQTAGPLSIVEAVPR